jgi:hypothetical protein
MQASLTNEGLTRDAPTPVSRRGLEVADGPPAAKDFLELQDRPPS